MSICLCNIFAGEYIQVRIYISLLNIDSYLYILIPCKARLLRYMMHVSAKQTIELV